MVSGDAEQPCDSRCSTFTVRAPGNRHVFTITAIHDFYDISGTGEALLDVNDLLGVQLENDNLQSFDQVG